MAAKVSPAMLLQSIAASVPCHATRTTSAGSETTSLCKRANLYSKEACTQQASLEQNMLAA